MSKININRVVEATNYKIGYANFEREENMKKKRSKKTMYVLMGVGILTVGTVSVNALTDNYIGKTIDNLKVKVNGESYNSNCTKREDGSIYCKVGNTGTEYIIYDESNKFDYTLDITTDQEGVKIKERAGNNE
ncbi:MAG: hypothetical protein K2G03_01405 [Bacilli bacterium]|nr:hypothetical protein [Bacilli bacterium]